MTDQFDLDAFLEDELKPVAPPAKAAPVLTEPPPKAVEPPALQMPTPAIEKPAGPDERTERAKFLAVLEARREMTDLFDLIVEQTAIRVKHGNDKETPAGFYLSVYPPPLPASRTGIPIEEALVAPLDQREEFHVKKEWIKLFLEGREEEAKAALRKYVIERGGEVLDSHVAVVFEAVKTQVPEMVQTELLCIAESAEPEEHYKAARALKTFRELGFNVYAPLVNRRDGSVISEAVLHGDSEYLYSMHYAECALNYAKKSELHRQTLVKALGLALGKEGTIAKYVERVSDANKVECAVVLTAPDATVEEISRLLENLDKPYQNGVLYDMLVSKYNHELNGINRKILALLEYNSSDPEELTRIRELLEHVSGRLSSGALKTEVDNLVARLKNREPEQEKIDGPTRQAEEEPSVSGAEAEFDQMLTPPRGIRALNEEELEQQVLNEDAYEFPQSKRKWPLIAGITIVLSALAVVAGFQFGNARDSAQTQTDTTGTDQRETEKPKAPAKKVRKSGESEKTKSPTTMEAAPVEKTVKAEPPTRYEFRYTEVENGKIRILETNDRTAVSTRTLIEPELYYEAMKKVDEGKNSEAVAVIAQTTGAMDAEEVLRVLVGNRKRIDADLAAAGVVKAVEKKELEAQARQAIVDKPPVVRPKPKRPGNELSLDAQCKKGNLGACRRMINTR